MSATYNNLPLGSVFRFKDRKTLFVKIEDRLIDAFVGKERLCASTLAAVESIALNMADWKRLSGRARFEINRLAKEHQNNE